MNKHAEEIKRLAKWHEAQAKWMWNSADTKEKHRRTAKWLRSLSWNVCGAGYVCRGGDDCDSDHK